MEIDFGNMGIDELETIYMKAERSLQKLLLSGAPWSELQEKMLLVTQLSIVIHKHKYPLEAEKLK